MAPEIGRGAVKTLGNALFQNLAFLGQRLYVAGDSMDQVFGSSLVNLAEETGLVKGKNDYHVSSGLSRPDFYDWPQRLVDQIVVFRPDAAVVLFGGDFLKLAYGPLWTEAAPILRILAFAGVLNTIHVSWSGLFGATGKPRYSFFAMSAQVSVFLVLIVPAARRYGLLGVGASVCAAAAAAFLLELGFASRILGLPKRALASGMSIPLLASLVMGGGTVLIRRLIARPAPAASLSIPGFVALAAAALAIYAAAAFLLDPGLGKRIRRDLSSAGPQ